MFRQWSEMFRQQSSRQLKIQTRHLHYYIEGIPTMY